MSEEQTEQTVVENTDGQATPASEEPSAREDDLDTLLSQYDEGSKSEPEPKAGAADDLKQLSEEVKALRAEQANVAFQADMNQTIGSVRGDLDPEFFDDMFVEAWIEAQAKQDARLGQAWAERSAKPREFAKVVTQLGKNFSDKFSKLPDPAATADREAVAHAVRGASTRAPEGKPPSYGNMSDNEYADSVEKDFGFRPL